MVIANLIGALEGPELLIILALVLVLFGGKKLPELARSLGQAKREFHDGVAGPTESSATTALPSAAAEEEEEMVALPKSELDRLRKAARESAE